MKYRKCPRCGLNYIKTDEELCAVCKDELAGKPSVFDLDDAELILCPYCEREFMGIDDLMCKKCWRKRNKNHNDEN